jgi:hypothetical protein
VILDVAKNDESATASKTGDMERKNSWTINQSAGVGGGVPRTFDPLMSGKASVKPEACFNQPIDTSR